MLYRLLARREESSFVSGRHVYDCHAIPRDNDCRMQGYVQLHVHICACYYRYLRMQLRRASPESACMPAYPDHDIACRYWHDQLYCCVQVCACLAYAATFHKHSFCCSAECASCNVSPRLAKAHVFLMCWQELKASCNTCPN